MLKVFICIGKFIYKDYSYLCEICVKTGLLPSFALKTACVDKTGNFVIFKKYAG